MMLLISSLREKIFILAKKEYFLLLIILFGFVTFQLSRPMRDAEVKGDEVMLGLQVFRYLQNQPTFGVIEVLEKKILLQSSWNHGALECYLLLPLIWLFGPVVEPLRLLYMAVGMAILWMTYFFGKAFFNSRVGLLAAFLLSLNPAFHRIILHGGFYGFTLPLFTMGSLLLFYRWHSTKKSLYLILGCFVLGLGWNVKGWFIWYLGVLAFYFCVFYLWRYRPKVHELFSGGIAFLVAVIPLLPFYFFSSFLQTSSPENGITVNNINNFDFYRNIGVRLHHLALIVLGRAAPEEISLVEGYVMLPFLIFVTFAAMILWRGNFGKLACFSIKKVNLIALCLGGTLLNSIFTLTTHRPDHLYFLFPFIQCLLAASFFEFMAVPESEIRLSGDERYQKRRKKKQRWDLYVKKAVLVFSLIAVIGMNIAELREMWVEHARDLERKKLCRLEAVHDWFKQNDVKKFAASSWDMVMGLQYLSDGDIWGRSIGAGPLLSHSREIIKRVFSSEERPEYFIVSQSLYSPDFPRMLKEQGVSFEVLRSFCDEYGKPRHLIFYVPK